MISRNNIENFLFSEVSLYCLEVLMNTLQFLGLFFLGLPRGSDTVVFNLHRIYGPLRLAMLMTGILVTFLDRSDCRQIGKQSTPLRGVENKQPSKGRG
ncbi:unnamed protein product, partial [Haemonchus placei]|uniref:Cytochrome b561 domain-containing protein n=1 Tax=Haemonchus placei TaxID=6290 RepID=A0A0N4VZR6_HAEPC